MRAFLAAALVAIALAGCDQQPLQHGPTLVAFTATWCQPCQRDKPLLKQVASEFPVSELDFDLNRKMANRLGIYSVPIYLVYDWEGAERLRTHDLKAALEHLRQY